MSYRDVPIAIFVYKRPEHTRQTITSLLGNKEAANSRLFIFSDAPKTVKDYEDVQKVRTYIHSLTGFASIKIIEQPENLGLAHSIISGVTSILEQEERVIVLEDDLLLSPYFLQYMHEGLELYKQAENVAAIHGYLYPLDVTAPDSFFIRGTDCWGWATWSRAWAKFNPDGAWLLSELERLNLSNAFDFNGTARYIAMLKKQIAGTNDSWAIRWSASAYLENMHTLYPGTSLVQNIGMDGQGTHSDKITNFDTPVSDKPISLKPIVVKENIEMFNAFSRFHKKLHPPLLKKILRKFF